MNELATLLETALVAYLQTFKVLGSALQPFTLYPGHSGAKKEDSTRITITASNLGGGAAYAGSFDAEVLIKIETSTDDQGLAAHAAAVAVVGAIFAQSNDQHADNHNVVVAWLNTFDGLGCSAFGFDWQTGTKEARNSEQRQHGTALPYKFSVHLRAA